MYVSVCMYSCTVCTYMYVCYACLYVSMYVFMYACMYHVCMYVCVFEASLYKQKCSCLFSICSEPLFNIYWCIFEAEFFCG